MKRWHYMLLTIGLCAMSASYAHGDWKELPPAPKPKVEYVYVREAVNQPKPTCISMPIKGWKAEKIRTQLALAVPATALQSPRRR